MIQRLASFPVKPDADPITMYSKGRPENLFWRGIIEELLQHGLTETQIQSVLQSKHMRWMLDDGEDRIMDVAARMLDGYANLDGLLRTARSVK